MYELLLVKDGQYLGRPKADPGLADGMYIIVEKGRADLPVADLYDGGLWESVDSEMVVSETGLTRYLDCWPMLTPGLSIHLYGKDLGYFLVEGQTDLAKRLASWWSGWGKKIFWTTVGTSRLNPHRQNYAKSHRVQAVVGVETSVGLDNKTPLCDQVAAEMGPQLRKVKKIIDRLLAPIGARVTELYPYWQRYVPMVWVHFEVNGVDPTKGQGCLCYPNGDFYYGPWCQRIGQHDSDSATHMLYDSPPSMTLVDWITGPLYEASQRYKTPGYYFSGSQQLPKFKPSNFAVGVYGEARAGVDRQPNFMALMSKYEPMGVDINTRVMRKALKQAEVSEINGDFVVLQKWNLGWGNLSTNGTRWMLQLRAGELGENYFKPQFEIDIKDSFIVGGRATGCDCPDCKNRREQVRRCHKTFMASLGIKLEEKEQDLTWAKMVATAIGEEMKNSTTIPF